MHPRLSCETTQTFFELKILIVKLSSLGDVVHAMPAVQDIRAALPGAQIDWVVERAFAPLVARCAGVGRVVACALRRWRKAPFAAQTRAEWRAFKADLQAEAYDAVIDLQGLSKSALVARLAKLSASGKRYAMANRTEGSGYEAPTRWVADVAITLAPHVHAVQRSRLLCAAALGYALPSASVASGLSKNFGLFSEIKTPKTPANSAYVATKTIAIVFGSSRADKCWPLAYWVQLGQRLQAQGYAIALPQGSAAEEQQAQQLASALQGGAVQVWPRQDLGAVVDALAACGGVLGVDSGLSHIAVALNLPHVQLYNFDTAWRTGPLASLATALPRQVSVFAQPCPSVEAVWQAWLQVAPPRGPAAPEAA